jgi:uncharacterized iron-regulated membrane protein
MHPRRWVLRLHRVLSATVGIWFIFQALSGLVLEWQDQVNAWSRPELYEHGRGDKGPAAALAAARARVPAGTPRSVALPTIERGVYRVDLAV